MIALVVSALLSAAALLSFSWSITTAKAVLPCAVVAASIGALGASGLAAKPQGGLAVWAFLFACGSCGSSVNAARNLFTRPVRWVHRFAIYSGYGATFAAMGALALCLQTRAASGHFAVIACIAAYVIGSTCIFLAKTLTARRAAKTMLEYRASLNGGADNQGYW